MKILIYSTYKSGSTAVYEAIRQSGAHYDTYYEPADLRHINFSRVDILCKYLNIENYESDADILEKFDKIILLVRNPIDRLISTLHFIPNVGMNFTNDNNAKIYLELLEKKSSNPDNISLVEIITTLEDICAVDFLNKHQDFNKGLILAKNKISNIFVLRYEDFIAGETRSLNEYLGRQVRSGIELPNNLSIIGRTKSQGEWINWCTPDDLEYFSRTLATFNKTFSYDCTPTVEGVEKVIPHEKTVGYITRCINDYRRRNRLPDHDGTIIIGKEGELFDRAEHFFQMNDYPQAERMLCEAIRENSSLPGFFLKLSRILERQGRLAEAITAAKHALTLNEDNLHAHGMLAEFFNKTHEAKKALEHGERAVALDDGHAAAHIQCGHALNQLGKPDAAMAHVKTAIKLDQENPFPFSFLADLYLKQSRPKDAERVLKKAIALKSDFGRFHFQLSRALDASGAHHAALDALRTALEFDQNNANYLAFMKKLTKTPTASGDG